MIEGSGSFDHVIQQKRKLALFLVRVRVSAYASVRDWVRVRVEIILEGWGRVSKNGNRLLNELQSYMRANKLHINKSKCYSF